MCTILFVGISDRLSLGYYTVAPNLSFNAILTIVDEGTKDKQELPFFECGHSLGAAVTVHFLA